MDKASLIGSILGVMCCVAVGYMASHGAWSMFYSEKGLIMVFGGTISVIFMAMPMEKIKCVPGYMRRFLFHKGKSPTDVIKLMGDLSEKARREGLLALEADIQGIEVVDERYELITRLGYIDDQERMIGLVLGAGHDVLTAVERKVGDITEVRRDNIRTYFTRGVHIDGTSLIADLRQRIARAADPEAVLTRHLSNAHPSALTTHVDILGFANLLTVPTQFGDEVIGTPCEVDPHVVAGTTNRKGVAIARSYVSRTFQFAREN